MSQAKNLNIVPYIVIQRWYEVLGDNSGYVKLCPSCYNKWLINIGKTYVLEPKRYAHSAQCKQCRKYTKEYDKWLRTKNKRTK